MQNLIRLVRIFLIFLFFDFFTDPKQPFRALKQPKFVVNFESIKSNALSANPKQVLDARGGKRFNEKHIPQSFSTPFTDLFNEDKTFKSKEELEKYFKQKNVDISSEIVTSCGSGITACIIAHALFNSVGKEVSVYDGSFSEWKVRAPELIGKLEE